jgi:hypothetical protein
MKKIISIFGLLIFFSSGVVARSVDGLAATGVVVSRTGTTFKVFYRGAELTDVKVSIYDDNNNIVFSEMIRKTDGFVRPYNFYRLPEGKYSIKVVDATGAQVESVNYQHDKVRALSHVRQIPGTRKFLLTIPNDDPTEITIKIRDDANAVIYEQKENISGDFGKLYNLEKVQGSLAFEVTHGNNTTKIFRD